MRHLYRLMVRLACVCCFLVCAEVFAQDDVKTGARTSLERMRIAHLKGTHEDVLSLQERRKVLPPLVGLHDFRAIFHAHAEDSAHTGGTRPEMLAEARKAGVKAIFLSDHYRPPRDFFLESWRGMHDGVLFIPGSEERGFLIAPSQSVLKQMEAPLAEFIAAVKAKDGLIFLSHIEERVNHTMDELDGMEIYNRHFDAKQDKAGVLALFFRLTDTRSLSELKTALELYPRELFAFHMEYPRLYLEKWDRETRQRRITGIAANDCHHNQVLIAKMVSDSEVLIGTNVDRDDQMQRVSALLRSGIKELTKGHKPSDILARVDLDPYERSFRSVSTHILASELSEPALRQAIRAGRVYVSHDWICDPTGFRLEYTTADGDALRMGSEARFVAPGGTIRAQFPVPCQVRLIRNGKEAGRVSGASVTFPVGQPGVYRVEAWVVLDDEERPWLYSNPIYLR